MNRSILVSNGQSGQALFIPSQEGLVLTTSANAQLGLTWAAPPRGNNGPSSITVDGVRCEEADLTMAFDRARTLPNGVIQFTQNNPAFKVIMQKTSKMRTVHFTDMSGQMLGQNMVLSSVIPPCSRPIYAVNQPIFVSNQGVKAVGAIMVSTNGTVEIWPTITKNNNAWQPAPFYIEGFSITWISSMEPA